MAELWSGAYSRQKAGAAPETNQEMSTLGSLLKRPGQGAPQRRSLRREQLQRCVPGSVAWAPCGESRAGRVGLIARFIRLETQPLVYGFKKF